MTYADNSQKDVTQDVVWISSNPAVCTVKDGVDTTGGNTSGGNYSSGNTTTNTGTNTNTTMEL